MSLSLWPDLGVVQAVRVSRIEEGDALVERRVQQTDGAVLVALALGGQPHAPEADRPHAGATSSLIGRILSGTT